MSFRFRLTLWASLVLILSGCVKTAEKVIIVPAQSQPPRQVARMALNGPHDGQIPDGYRNRLEAVEAGDWTIPHLLLAVADHFEAGGDGEKALHFLDKTAEAFAVRGDASGEALVFSRKVLLLQDICRETDAFALMGEGWKKWKEPPLRAFPEYVEGRLALMQGDFPRARWLLELSLRDNENFGGNVNLLRLKRDTDLAAGIAGVLSVHLPGLLGPYRQRQAPGDGVFRPGKDGASLREALALNGELRRTDAGSLIPAADFQRVEAEVYAFLGLDEGMKGHGAESLRRLVHAAELSRVAGFRGGEIRSLLFLGELGLTGINREDGRRAAVVARERSDLYRSAPYRIWARLLWARYEKERGRTGEAIAALREADGILSGLRIGPEAEMLVEVCRSQRRAVYEFLVELLAAEGRAEEALVEAEKAKALRMVDLLARQEIGGNPVERELLRQERESGETIRSLQRLILQVSAESPTEELLRRLNSAEADYRNLLGRVGTENAGLLSLISVRGIDSAALRRLLDENTTLFDYFSTEGGLYVWAIQRETVHLERIDLTREELRALVFSLLSAIHDKSKRRTESLSRKAYDALLKPVIPYVSGERIGFIPDDCLNYFPFAAMNYRGKLLAEGFSIFELPRASLLGEVTAKQAPSGMRILAFGDPDLEDEELDLHHAAEELRRIRKRIGQTTVLLHEQASEAKAAELMADYDILHFAVRVQFDPDQPLASGLLLTPGAGQDGTLTIAEIFRLRYPGRAVVLSGCDTLPEKDPEAEGFVALQRALIHAGSPWVLSSLWLVDDRAASRLMDLFYRQLAKKDPPADALRAAQLQLLKEGYPPYVWAAFVLTGRY